LTLRAAFFGFSQWLCPLENTNFAVSLLMLKHHPGSLPLNFKLLLRRKEEAASAPILQHHPQVPRYRVLDGTLFFHLSGELFFH